MSPTAVFSRPGHFGSVEWDFDELVLRLRAPGLPPEEYHLREVSSIAGDDFTIHLGYRGDTLTFSRLGSEGAGLREKLLQEWPSARARALGVTGSGSAQRYTGFYSPSDGIPAACSALLYDDVLVMAPTGADVYPIHLSSLSEARFDESAGTITLRTWRQGGGTLSRLGAKAGELAEALDRARAALSTEAADVVSAGLPGLSAGARAALAARWLPGEMLSLAALEAGSPGIDAALRSGWISGEPRAGHAEILIDWSDQDRVHVGYEHHPASSARPLWLLAGRGDRWFLENLSEQDYSTYGFQAGAEMPMLASFLLRTRRFSREALYLPLEELTGPHADLAVPARDLQALRSLRERFVERVGHEDPAAWAARVKGSG